MKYILSILIILSVVGCKCQKSAAKAMESTDEQSTLTLLASDTYGGTETPEFRVIRKGSDLKSFYAEINKTRKPGLPVPEVDFSREILVVYCTGKTQNAEIPDLFTFEELEEQIILGKKYKKADPSLSENKPVLMPFGVYKMPFTEKPVVLRGN